MSSPELTVDANSFKLKVRTLTTKSMFHFKPSVLRQTMKNILHHCPDTHCVEEMLNLVCELSFVLPEVQTLS